MAEYEDSDLICCATGDYLWMYGKVCNNAKYDIKVRERWNDWMEEIDVPIYFYGSKFLFWFEDDVINAEQFGNILFGASGNAGGYDMIELTFGGSGYSFITGDGFDNADDREMIGKGYELYEKNKRVYSYLH